MPPGSRQAPCVASCPSPDSRLLSEAGSIAPARRGQTKTPAKNLRRFRSGYFCRLVAGLLIVVEPALARLVVPFAPRTIGRSALMTPRGFGDLGAAAAVEPAGRRSTGEIGASIAHRTAVAAAAGTTARAGAAVTATATTSVA